MFDPATHEEIVNRIRRLRPDAQRRFGRMAADQMVAHLTDQMRHTLGDAIAQPRPGVLRIGLVRHAVIYWLPWPKGHVKGPPDAFVTQPTHWDDDIRTLIGLLDRFVARDPAGEWPEHAFFGPMTGKDWGVFCHKHFNHHLSQFGV
jgi:hypothetical protein